MIAIDTNVLLRYLLDDDEEQSKRATKLLAWKEKVLITDTVLIETVWTLKGKKYNVDREGIGQVINALFEEPNIRFEDAQSVWSALRDYRNAPKVKSGGKNKQADFPDALIVNKAKRLAEKLGEELSGVYTFDIAALALPDTKNP